LTRSVFTGKADRTLRIHDALPWKFFPRRGRVERVTNETRLPRQPRDARHLAVGRYSATWYSRHDVVNPTMQSLRRDCRHGLSALPA
jgi:hypothetical protein